MKDCPCKECDERIPGCHSKCDNYKKFEQKCKEIRERRYTESKSIYYPKSIEKLALRRRKERS